MRLLFILSLFFTSLNLSADEVDDDFCGNLVFNLNADELIKKAAKKLLRDHGYSLGQAESSYIQGLKGDACIISTSYTTLNKKKRFTTAVFYVHSDEVIQSTTVFAEGLVTSSGGPISRGNNTQTTTSVIVSDIK